MNYIHMTDFDYSGSVICMNKGYFLSEKG